MPWNKQKKKQKAHNDCVKSLKCLPFSARNDRYRYFDKQTRQ